ncbi:elongation factor G [Amycolatopsis cihanbeyliensis]|uniref:Ribosomal protection tetracycline resistance protein n=1 Tax=Amycolatopsis cihanbeyliensis TaxID=1128664 RepID=A0A542CUS4_AMYCI|nr:TetM/TetW/TetO/TetS family tetracycline resistance ribosomal protection protein [Amycolatopsis cihanbeyliensis]TQI94572.1 ribosomal protection tetracycline resistance protein [Amycolatopsis cihanbeyliensis]
MNTLNLGILAHVDAGKTSLTERLLHAAGVIDEVGSVDEGSTRTDSLALERARGITIKSAVVSFVVDDVTINLIDTPGHPDFIAEVERVLTVLDGAVLVLSAVEGVQAQTRVLMRTLRRLGIPTLLFVNKIDRRGADTERVCRDIAAKLSSTAISMGRTHGQGTRGCGFVPYGATTPGFPGRLTEVLAERDDDILAAYLGQRRAVPYDRLRTELSGQTGQAVVYPVYFGSAMTGAGIPELITGITGLLPAGSGEVDGPAAGGVFKVERGPAGERVAYVRMFSGTVRVRDRLRLRDGSEGKVTAIEVFDRGGTTRRTAVSAGRIGLLHGLGGVRIGDPIGVSGKDLTRQHFAPPTLETVVVPRHQEQRGALHLALTQLAEQDPLINLRQDDLRKEIAVSLYGEVQKEVIGATLTEEFGVAVTFRETTTICLERPAGTGAAAEILHEGENPFLATVGLRVDPAPPGTGVDFRLEVEPGSLPSAFRTAVEETVRETLSQGIHGWEVTDCVVTMTRSGYLARQSRSHGTFDKSMSSTAGDFRNLTPLVLMDALCRAGTRVYEPLHHFRIELPEDTLGTLAPVLAQLDAVPRETRAHGAACLLEGEIPAARVHELHQRLPGLTRGEGVLECAYHRHEPVRGPAPSRPRTDHNPLNRKEYLLNARRRVRS